MFAHGWPIEKIDHATHRSVFWVHPVKPGKPYKRMPSRRKALAEALFSPSGSIGSVRLSSEHTYRSGPLPPGTPCACRPVGTILPLPRPSRARPAARCADLDRLSRGRNYISQGRRRSVLNIPTILAATPVLPEEPFFECWAKPVSRRSSPIAPVAR